MMPGLSRFELRTNNQAQERNEQRKSERHPLDRMLDDFEVIWDRLSRLGINEDEKALVCTGLVIAGRIANLESAVRGPKK